MKTSPSPCPDDALSAEQLLRKADSVLKAGGSEDAKRYASAVLGRDPAHVGALEILAKAQWNLGEHTRVLQTLGKLMRINPYEPGYHVLKGEALRQLGRYGEATRAFVRAGDAKGTREAVAELSALQSDLVLQLLEHDPIFRTHYRQNPEAACASRGFEFGSETKIRHEVMANEYSSARVLQRPS